MLDRPTALGKNSERLISWLSHGPAAPATSRTFPPSSTAVGPYEGKRSPLLHSYPTKDGGNHSPDEPADRGPQKTGTPPRPRPPPSASHPAGATTQLLGYWATVRSPHTPSTPDGGPPHSPAFLAAWVKNPRGERMEAVGEEALRSALYRSVRGI